MSPKMMVKVHDAAECRMRCPGKLEGCSPVSEGFKDQRDGCGSFDWQIVQLGASHALRCTNCGAEFGFDRAHPPLWPAGPEWWAIGATVEEVPE